MVGVFVPKGLQRRYSQHQLHFITCSCYRRLPLLASARAKNLFVKVLGEVRDCYGFALAGFVVMPEHIHLLIGEPAKGTPSTVMQVLKQRVSRRMRCRQPRTVTSKQLKLPFRAAAEPLPRFWQFRFYDFRARALLGARQKHVWSRGKFVEKLHYMHMNPVKRKLVKHPRDWPWSSFSFYAKKDSGLIRIGPQS